MSSPQDRDPKGSGLRSASMLLMIPSLLVAAPLAGFFLGRYVDHRFHSDPWGVVLGIVLGFGAAGREIYAIVRRVEAEEESDSGPRH